MGATVPMVVGRRACVLVLLAFHDPDRPMP